MVKTKLAKNTLYQYRGGGYEGCVWEWNFCYLDKKGKFHDIHSSGYAAITYKEQLQALIDTAETSFHTKKPFTYDLANADDRLEFVRECNPGHVIGVAKWLSENADIELDLECKECGHSHHVEDMIPEGVESAGGLAFQYSSMICADCESNYTCCNCGE